MGSNVLAGTRPEAILKAYRAARQKGKSGKVPPYWDGKAAERIWESFKSSLVDWFSWFN